MRLSWAALALLLYLPAIDAAFWNWKWKSRSNNKWEVWFYTSDVPDQAKPKKIKGKGSVRCAKITSKNALFYSARMPKLGGCTVYLWEDMQSCKTKRFYGELGYIHKDKQEYAWPNWKYEVPEEAMEYEVPEAMGVKAYAVDCERPKLLDEKLDSNQGSSGAKSENAGGSNAGHGNTKENPGDSNAGNENTKENGNTGDDNSGHGNTEESPGGSNVGHGNIEETPGDSNAGNGNTEENPRDYNTGHGNIEENPGDSNAGHGNTEQNGNTGDDNTDFKGYTGENSGRVRKFKEEFDFSGTK